MKRTTLYVALASSLSLSPFAFANDSSWSKATQRVESMNDQQGQSQSQEQSPDLVKQAQEKLSALGKNVGTPDGQMNSRTQQALQEFQRDNGLQPSGQLDQQTLAALDINQSGSASGSPASESN
jgi:peptidoglycan hydrolase-like protein with peptidoglycan-binding domain